MASRKMIRKMDKVFGAYIRSLGYCEKTGKTKDECQLQWCHIFSRKFMSTRWSETNSLCLSAGAHRWAHDNPILFVEWLKEHLGEETYDKLKLEHNQIKKWNDFELEELIKEYKDKKRGNK